MLAGARQVRQGVAETEFDFKFFVRFLLRDYMCIGVSPTDKKTATITHCGRAGSWTYDPSTKRFRHSSSANAKCLSLQRVQEGSNIVSRAHLVQCDPNDPNQEWAFTRYKKTGLKYTELS